MKTTVTKDSRASRGDAVPAVNFPPVAAALGTPSIPPPPPFLREPPAAKKSGAKAKALCLLMLMGVLAGCPASDNPDTNIENPDNPNQPDNPGTEVLPALTIGSSAATIAKDAQNSNTLNVAVTIPAEAAVEQVVLKEGQNFTFVGKTFNLNITFASGTYNDDMVEAIKGKFTAKEGSIGLVITTPEKQSPAGEITLPTLAIGEAKADITENGTNPNTFDVAITVPNGAPASQIALSDGINFTFSGKTFNLNITFASNSYDDDMVNAIKGKFTAKEGIVIGAVNTTPEKPGDNPNTPDNPGTVVTQPTLKIDGVAITISVPAEGLNTIEVVATVSNGVVADFEDPDGLLKGKTVKLTLAYFECCRKQSDRRQRLVKEAVELLRHFCY